MKTMKLAVIAALGAAAAGGLMVAARGTAKEGPHMKTMAAVRLLDAQGGLTEVQKVPKVMKTDQDWQRQLTPEQYEIARGKGTERAFCGLFHDQKEPGIYSCVCCGLPLFKSDAKFESGTGWPSFFAPVAAENTANQEDLSLGMQRTEVLCARCDAHLGHVFDDGPPPTGLRYCLNSASLTFAPASAFAAAGKSSNLETATFAAGCFWHVEEVFRQVSGVVTTQVGYTGGTLRNPTYEDVCSHQTGHAEAVEVQFDPARISYEDLVKVFWKNHDPTTPNRQGPDVGSQYRSAIFYHSDQQRDAALALREKLDKSRAYSRPIATQIVPAKKFWRAEEYHQRYVQKTGRDVCPIL